MSPTDLVGHDVERAPARPRRCFAVYSSSRESGWKADQATRRLAELAAGAAAVGGSADYQARWLREERDVTIPLLLDPAHRFREAVGAAEPLACGW